LTGAEKYKEGGVLLLFQDEDEKLKKLVMYEI
jgi:hypothetical protein